MTIQQGDEYSLPIRIKMNGSFVGSSDIQDIRIQVGEFLKSYVAGELTYDSESQQWLYPMDEEMTRSFTEELTPIQVGIKLDNMLIYSPVRKLNVYKSIIKKEWN